MTHINFKETKAYPLIKEFILKINNSIKDAPRRNPPPMGHEEVSTPVNEPLASTSDNSFTLNYTLLLLNKIKQIVTSTPLSEVRGRYANPAMAEVINSIEKLANENTIGEGEYLKNAFGNKIRMDFGTGHELNFLCFIYSIFKGKETKAGNNVKMTDQMEMSGQTETTGQMTGQTETNGQMTNQIGTTNQTDQMTDAPKGSSLGINQISLILMEYFRIVRHFIAKFNVEAAGSRGCWSIDDYLLLPYLFGSAENFHHPVAMFSGRMFLEACQGNNSAMLRDMCKLPWPTINVGMYEMYVKEVLGRHVVTQHFIYSECLPVT